MDYSVIYVRGDLIIDKALLTISADNKRRPYGTENPELTYTVMGLASGDALTTAPTWTQVSKVLWGEIHAHAARSRVKLPKPSTTELRFGPKNYALGLSNEGVRYQGIRAPHTLVVLDEAPGVRPDIWEAIAGIAAAGDVRVLAIGNPTIPGGPFYQAFTTQREGEQLYTISAFDTPNMAGLRLEDVLAMDADAQDQNVRPYLTTRRFVVEAHRDYGPTSAFWQARARLPGAHVETSQKEEKETTRLLLYRG